MTAKELMQFISLLIDTSHELKELKEDLEKFSIHQIKNNASDKI